MSINLKTQFRYYGFIWLVLLYISILITFDYFGFFVAKTKVIFQYTNKVVELKLKVVSEPDEKSNRIEFIAETSGKVKLLAKYYDLESAISQYDILKVRGKILPLPKPRNPGQFDYGKYLLRKGVYGILIIEDYTIEKSTVQMHSLILQKIHIWLNKFILTMRQKMITTIKENFPGEESSILIAMFAGEKAELLPEIRSWFVDSGVMHTLVVSGLHVGYVVAIFWFLLRWVLVGGNRPTSIRWLLLIPPLLVYCLVTGAAPPVMRATLIVLVFILCFLLGREKVVYHAVAFAALIILILNPQALFSASFQLSFAVCLGIVYISPKLMKFVNRPSEVVDKQTIGNKLIHYLRLTTYYLLTLFFISLSAQLATAPLLEKYFYKLSVVALISNLSVVPTVGIILWLCFVLFFSSIICDFVIVITGTIQSLEFLVSCASSIVKLSGYICYISSHWLIRAVKFFATQPGAIVITGEPNILFIIIYYVLLISIFKFKRVIHQLIGFIVLLLFIIFTYNSLPLKSHNLRITFLDVNLGDAIFIKSPGGENVFIDCGGDDLQVGKRVFVPFLFQQGITEIDRIFITSSNWTHYSGLKTIIQEFKVKEILVVDSVIASEPVTFASERSNLTFISNNEFSHLVQIAKANNIDIRIIKSNNEFLLDKTKKLKLEVFYQLEKPLISKLTYGNLSILFTSDNSQKDLKNVITQYNINRITVLQYPAHGKGKISQEILKELSPEYIVISTDNLPENTFQLSLSKIYSTAQYGAISIISNGKTTKVMKFVKSP